jgi:superfamily II DNA or RNA helicase
MGWRKHQQDLLTITELMKFDRKVKTVIAWVTSGGGKSALPIIFSHRLIPSIAQKIAWITPRDNLRSQGELNYIDKEFRKLLGHQLEIRATEPEIDPSRGKTGFVTTYHSIVADAKNRKFFVDDFLKYNYLLVLDEPHHIARDSEYHKAIQQLYDLSAAQLLMSGTLDRSNNGPIAFLPYLEPDMFGKSPVDLSDTETLRFIQYDMRAALGERAIIPMYFELLDGAVSWEKYGAEFKADKISEVDNSEIGDAIYTTLRTDFAHHLLLRTIDHWRAHRIHNPRSLLLVVAPSQKLGRTYLQWVKDAGIIKSDIAISDESKIARENIAKFRNQELEVLVTVQMAYEGMDVPPITHIACLTHIRARPWIEQMLARAIRYDKDAGPWGQQKAWIFAPDDQWFRDVMQEIKEIQEPFYRLPDEGPPPPGPFEPTVPLSSSVDSARGTGLEPEEEVDSKEHEELTEALKEVGLYGLATTYQAKMLRSAVLKNKPTRAPEETVSKREDDIKTKIEDWINSKFYKGDGQIIIDINTAIKNRYHKRRPDMTEQELQTVWDERFIWSAPFKT